MEEVFAFTMMVVSQLDIGRMVGCQLATTSESRVMVISEWVNAIRKMEKRRIGTHSTKQMAVKRSMTAVND